MKIFIYKFLLAGIFLINVTSAPADIVTNTKFSTPGKMCFLQTSLHINKDNDLSKIMLSHYLVVPQEDHFKAGALFVGFRLKSQPETLWLYDGDQVKGWSKYDGTNVSAFLPSPYTIGGGAPATGLQPITPVYISSYPIDVSAYIDDGELWVGYGLSTEETKSFDEMIDSKRFQLIWEIGKPVMDHEYIPTICIAITEMTSFVPLATTQ